ncbi:MAG TPA: tetratricopeptide repeat protein [Chthoniobacterales bacterium]|nr:tetratricopeptide repeat protein [Chthoniobacterales bacterium]
MNTGAAFRIAVLSAGLALSVLFCPRLTAQQESEPSPEQANLPSDTGSPGIVTDEGNSAATDTESEGESPSTAEEFHDRAETHAQNHEAQEAIAYYTQAIQLDPGNLEYLASRADLYGEAGDFSKALEDCEAILKIDPNNLRARLLRGRIV